MARVALNDEDEAFIKRQLDSGRFSDPSDVVRAALRLMEGFEDDRDIWLREVVPGRYEDIRQNPSIAVSLDLARARFEERHRADADKT